MAKVAAFMFTLAGVRGVQAVIENPAASTMFTFLRKPAHLDLWTGLVTDTADRCAFDAAPFGQRMLKKYKFLSTGAWIHGVHRRCRCAGAHTRLMLGSESGRVTGQCKLLKESQA